MLDNTGQSMVSCGQLMENSPMPRRAGRPQSAELRADWKLSLPASVAAEVDLLLEDPLTRKPKYGARSSLVEAMLRNWIALMKGQMPNTHVPDRAALILGDHDAN